MEPPNKKLHNITPFIDSIRLTSDLVYDVVPGVGYFCHECRVIQQVVITHDSYKLVDNHKLNCSSSK